MSCNRRLRCTGTRTQLWKRSQLATACLRRWLLSPPHMAIVKLASGCSSCFETLLAYTSAFPQVCLQEVVPARKNPLYGRFGHSFVRPGTGLGAVAARCSWSVILRWDTSSVVTMMKTANVAEARYHCCMCCAAFASVVLARRRKYQKFVHHLWCECNKREC